MHIKRNGKIIILLVALVIYGSSIVLLKGRFPNQTANLVTIRGSEILSLVLRQDNVAVNLPLEYGAWNISAEKVAAFNFNGNLIISGNYTNSTLYLDKTLPLFIAKQIGLDLNFTDNPYLQAVISSQPDTETTFLLGWQNQNQSATMEFLDKGLEEITEIDGEEGIVWIDISCQHGGEKIHNETSYVTIDVAKRLAELGLCSRHFVGLQIRQYLIGIMPFDQSYRMMIKSISLAKEPLYDVATTEGISRSLPDGSTVQIIRKEGLANNFEEYPYLQRAYVLCTIEAPQDALYTIFLLSKYDKNITVVRSDFVFTHTNHLNEIGTYVDWRRPLWLDWDFEPVATLYSVMENGDYAFIFTPLKGNALGGTQLYKVDLTFSKLQHSSFVITSFSEQVLLAMSLFLITIAGILPTILLCILFYVYKKNKLKDDKITAIKIIAIGLALRLILAPISAYADDIQIFSEIGALYFGSGILGAQWVSLPGFVYLETAAYFPYALLRALGFQDSQFLALAIYSGEALFTKLPSILCDLGSFYYISRIARKYFPKERMLVSGLFLLSPLTIYISGILGQFDSVFTFAVIASIYYLVAEYKIVKATIFSSFAALLNPVGIATLIPLFVKISLRENRRTVIKSLLLAASIIGILMLPFFFETQSPILLASYERLRSGIPGDAFYGKPISFYAYGAHTSSFVGYGLTFRFLPEMFGIELWPIFYPYGAAVLFLIIVGLFIYKTRKAYVTGLSDTIYIGTFMLGISSLFQLTFPTIFDQFVVWIVGLSLVSYILCKNRKLLFIFAFISIATGVIYVFSWRDYLLLISGVETVPLGNKPISGAISAIIGTLYSIVLFIILVILLKMWIKNTKLSKSLNTLRVVVKSRLNFL